MKVKILLVMCLLLVLAGCQNSASAFKARSPNQVLALKSKSNKLILVGRDSCSDCQKVKQFIEKHKNELKSKIIYVNLDAYKKSKQRIKLLKKYKISRVPTFLVINQNGTKVIHMNKITIRKLNSNM